MTEGLDNTVSNNIDVQVSATTQHGVTVNGVVQSAGSTLIEVVLETAQALGHSTVRVLLNGEEVSNRPQQEVADTVLQDGDVVTVAPYDKAG